MKRKMKRYAEGDLVDDVETTTDEEGNEVTIARRGYSPKVSAPASVAPSRTRSAARSTAPRAKASDQYAAAARSKYMEARGYDEASKNTNLSSEDRRAMLGRHAQAMKDYDTLGRAGKYAASKNMKSGGSVKSSASKRADGIASRGKTRGRMI